MRHCLTKRCFPTTYQGVRCRKELELHSPNFFDTDKNIMAQLNIFFCKFKICLDLSALHISFFVAYFCFLHRFYVAFLIAVAHLQNNDKNILKHLQVDLLGGGMAFFAQVDDSLKRLEVCSSILLTLHNIVYTDVGTYNL